jgi:ubiquinone/menaquinone biosynthesis C-methylase UbiE
MKKLITRQNVLSNAAIFGMKTVLRIKNNPKKMRMCLLKAGLKPGMKILDYGAGIGGYTFAASEIVEDNGLVIAVDILDTMINEIEDRKRKHKFNNITAKKIKSFTDIKEQGFDFILVIDILHMVDDQKEILSYYLNKLKTDGKLLLKLDHMSKKETDDLLKQFTGASRLLEDNDWWIIKK